MTVFPRNRVVVPSAARTASGSSGAIGVADSEAQTMTLLVDVTAQAGTGPTLTLSVEWSTDGTTFHAADPGQSFTQIGAATPKVAKRFDVLAPTYRVVWTLGGTAPSYTFAVTEHV
jgi:hypothetical protein